MGTWVSLSVYDLDESKANSAIDEAFETMRRYDAMFSGYNPKSELSRINKADPDTFVPLSDEMVQVLHRSLHFSSITQGAFDITIKPVLSMWRQYADSGIWPDMEALVKTRRSVGLKWVSFDAASKRIRLAREGMELDLGGIAKGYIVDKAKQTLLSAGIKHALVNAGGDLYALGSKPDGSAWQVGILDPSNTDQVLRVVEVKDKAVTTSGSYMRFMILHGFRFSHIIDPRTLMPIPEMIASVTVIAPTTADADALATSLAVLGSKEGIALVETLSDTEALVITFSDSGLEYHPTSGFDLYGSEKDR